MLIFYVLLFGVVMWFWDGSDKGLRQMWRWPVGPADLWKKGPECSARSLVWWPWLPSCIEIKFSNFLVTMTYFTIWCHPQTCHRHGVVILAAPSWFQKWLFFKQFLTQILCASLISPIKTTLSVNPNLHTFTSLTNWKKGLVYICWKHLHIFWLFA
jgi:hypothetical protein